MNRRTGKRAIVHAAFVVAIVGMAAWAMWVKARAGGGAPAAIAHEGRLTPVNDNGLFGYVGSKGEWVIPPQFSDVCRFHHGKAAVRVKNAWGYIDRTGTLVIPAVFLKAGNFRENGMAVVWDAATKKAGCIDEDGVYVAQPAYDSIELLDCGLGTFRQNDMWGILDRTGNVVVTPQFETVSQRVDGYLGVSWVEWLSGGKPVARSQALLLGVPYARVTQRVKYGLVKPDGTLLPGQYDAVDDRFSEGLLAVCLMSDPFEREGSSGVETVRRILWGFIDEDGAMVIEPEFHSHGRFENGRANVVFEDWRVAIDKTGAVIEELGPAETVSFVRINE